MLGCASTCLLPAASHSCTIDPCCPQEEWDNVVAMKDPDDADVHLAFHILGNGCAHVVCSQEHAPKAGDEESCVTTHAIATNTMTPLSKVGKIGFW